ncbi:hypothetical protein [Pseudonocardia alaniniphila]|uniref:Uncharacterized protein n=1 Tax=Pseudonocardia alaniniphila TaxID=75291 RepID=A0ABS9T9E8_9PSEU|nr:hypothetical protein [Pseudonocardia alaniniphila]MCH6165154.1 hypothetical protein [Pseudonocardia alaniniphila]
MSDNGKTQAAHLVDGLLGDRLNFAGNLPGLRQAVIALAAGVLETGEYEQLIRGQLSQLRHPSSTAIPDAYLAYEAAAEDALQHAAAGIRMAMAQNGHIGDAQSFERDAARRLGDDPRLAIRAELARVPRPLTRPQPLQWSITPAPWASDPRNDTLWPPPGLDATVNLRGLPGGAAALARVEAGPHVGWVQIGLIERQRTPRHRYPERPNRSILIGVGLEIADRERPEGSLPFMSIPWQVWTVPWQHIDATTNAERAAAVLKTNSWAVAALGESRLGATGLGEPQFLLVPALPLIVTLGLEPTSGVCGFSLSDQHGPAVVGRLWRGHLVHDGSYHPVFPAIDGADLLLRADLLELLLGVIGESRFRVGVVVRSHVGEDNTGSTT